MRIDKQKSERVYNLCRPVMGLIFKLYYNPTIINARYIPKEGPCIIAGNHKHALDPVLVDSGTKRAVHTLAKKDLHDSCFGWFYRAFGTIPVDLRAAHNKEALDTSIEYLKQGALINLSPEAQRNFTTKILLPFKYGAVVMNRRANCKIVPYSITGDYVFRSKNLKIVFGPPMDLADKTIEEANQILYETIKLMIIKNR